MMLPIDNKSELTDSDLHILDYIQSNIKDIPGISIECLAQATYVSRTTITRFVRKIGYGGYAEFKIAIRDIVEETNNYHCPDLMNRLLICDVGIQPEKVEFILQKLISARRVYLFGSNSLSSICYFVNFKFNYYDNKFKAPFAIYEIDSLIGDLVNPLTEDDVCLFLSYTGNTSRIIDYAKEIKSQGAYTVSVTCTMKNGLQKLVDYSVYINNNPIFDENNRLIASGIPFMYFLEILADKYYEYCNKSE